MEFCSGVPLARRQNREGEGNIPRIMPVSDSFEDSRPGALSQPTLALTDYMLQEPLLSSFKRLKEEKKKTSLMYDSHAVRERLCLAASQFHVPFSYRLQTSPILLLLPHFISAFWAVSSVAVADMDKSEVRSIYSSLCCNLHKLLFSILPGIWRIMQCANLWHVSLCIRGFCICVSFSCSKC